jgi:hypothetical protein
MAMKPAPPRPPPNLLWNGLPGHDAEPRRPLTQIEAGAIAAAALVFCIVAGMALGYAFLAFRLSSCVARASI